MAGSMCPPSERAGNRRIRRCNCALPVAGLNWKLAAVRVKTETEIREPRARVVWLLLIVAGATALFVAFFLDYRVATWISAHSSPEIKQVMRIISRVGDWPAHAIIGLIGIATALVLKSKVWLRIFLAMLLALALSGLAARVIKISTGRARPSVKTEAAWNGPQLSSKYHAFPSGHTACSTAFFVVLFLARKKIGGPLLLIPVLIAFSRMIVGAHYLSDITMAAILGILFALLATRWTGHIRSLAGK
jgi:undecaprenyl-diphosphatase